MTSSACYSFLLRILDFTICWLYTWCSFQCRWVKRSSKPVFTEYYQSLPMTRIRLYQIIQKGPFLLLSSDENYCGLYYKKNRQARAKLASSGFRSVHYFDIVRALSSFNISYKLQHSILEVKTWNFLNYWLFPFHFSFFYRIIRSQTFMFLLWPRDAL